MKYAAEKNIPVLQPQKLKDPAFQQALKDLQADVQVVVAFRMLPEVVWNMPPLGTINLHGSLLPQYRGAAPINWAVINGEKFTGVTTFKLKHEIDTGDILLQEKIEIGETETAGELHDRMKKIGADLILKTIQSIAEGKVERTPQSELTTPAVEIRHAPKLFTQTCEIDWNRSVDEVYNFIRGLSPYPAAYTKIDNKQVKIFRSEKLHGSPLIKPGEIDTDKKSFIHYACTDGYIKVTELQLQGKKKMATQDFLRGYRFN
jgi:methionyl-tRNA formyltransferase